MVVDGEFDVVVGDDVIVDVERIGVTPVGFRVVGRVRNVGPLHERDGLRIGLQISFDGPHQRRIAELFA